MISKFLNSTGDLIDEPALQFHRLQCLAGFCCELSHCENHSNHQECHPDNKKQETNYLPKYACRCQRHRTGESSRAESETFSSFVLEFLLIVRGLNMSRRRLFLYAGSIVAASLLWFPLAFGVRAAESLQTRVRDKAFWKMVSEFSEPDGTFRSDNLLSNEFRLQNVIPNLLKTAKPGGVYMGVGPEQNFTYIAAVKPAMAFIIDIRRGNLDLQLFYKAVFELSADRADFVSRLFARARPAGLTVHSTVQEIFAAYDPMPQNDALYAATLKAIQKQLVTKHGFALSKDDLEGIEYVYHAFALFGPRIQYSSTGHGFFGGGFGRFGPWISYADLMTATDAGGHARSYLATEESFAFLKTLETNNLIVPVVGDFAGSKAIRSVGRYLKEKEATVSVFYLSNVEMYLMRDGQWESFCANVSTLPLDESSTFIRSLRGGWFGQGGGLSTELGSMEAETSHCR